MTLSPSPYQGACPCTPLEESQITSQDLVGSTNFITLPAPLLITRGCCNLVSFILRIRQVGKFTYYSFYRWAGMADHTAMADPNRKYIGQNEECRTHVYRGLDARTLHTISDQFALCCRDGATLSAYTLTTYKLRLGERPSPHNAKYPQCMKNCIGLWIFLVYEYQ